MKLQENIDMSPAAKYSLQEQENMILNAAEKCIEESSLLDFSMAKLAKTAKLSMGSIYKHVQSKEDVWIALASNMYRHQLEVFRTILEMPFTTPEKIAAISLLDHNKIRSFSFDAQLDNLVSNPALLQRGSCYWLERMFKYSKLITSIFNQCLMDAVQSGEFKSGEVYVEEFNVATWSLIAGYFRQVQEHLSWDSEDKILLNDIKPLVSIDSIHIRSLQRLVNAYEWATPLSKKGLMKVCKHLETVGYR